MTRRLMLIAALALLPAPLLAQEGPPRRPPAEAPRMQGMTPEQRQAMQQRRAAMRAQVHARFVEIAAERLGLGAAERTRLGQVLDRTMEKRQALAEEGRELRLRAARALADSAGAPAPQAILQELTRLRERELQLWRDEQRELSTFLTPRQRLELMAMRARFDERVMQLRSGPGGGWIDEAGGPGVERPFGPGTGPRGPR